MKNDLYAEKKHEFWPHFLLGAVFGISGLFFFGTQKGRKLLKKALDATENLDFSKEELIEKIEGTLADGKEKIEHSLDKIGGSDTIYTVLQKIKSVIPHKE